MAILKQGILGGGRGAVGTVVMSQWRGKDVIRARVTPSNPNTAAQQGQRSRFAQAVRIVKTWGRSLYAADWNRAVGDLPGFQSLTTLLLRNVDRETGLLGVPAPVSLGALEGLRDLTVSALAPDEVGVSWTPGVLADGDGTDQVTVFGVERLMEAVDSYIPTPERSDRDDGAAPLTGLTPETTYLVGVYVRGATGNAGRLSECRFYEVTTPAA